MTMPEAVGSTFGGGGLAGLVFFVLYLVFGPGAVIFHVGRWAYHRYSIAKHSRATLDYDELQTIRQCLPWNVVITLIPVLGAVWERVHG
jgi:hypothetical protein